MLPQLVAFWRLSRPIFLLGGITLYALGAGIAHAQNCVIRPTPYVLGQLFVTSLQLMTHYLNEYWDVAADRLNESRTMFSGGSGVLAAGLLRRQTARTAAIVCTAAGVTAAALLAVLEGMSPLAWGLMLGMFLGAYFYSSPPLALAGSGTGELTASLVVACSVPALGLVLSGGRLSLIFAFASVPLVALHYAMLLALEFPDEPSDRTAGKRTLLVRIGRSQGALLHNSCLLAGIVLGLYGALRVMPTQTVLGTAIVAPLAVWQTFAVAAAARGQRVPLGPITFVAVAIFALAAVSLAAVFWSLPVVGGRDVPVGRGEDDVFAPCVFADGLSGRPARSDRVPLFHQLRGAASE